MPSHCHQAVEKSPLGRLFATPSALEAIPREDLIRAVSRHAAGDWNYYLAYNLFRIAAILQGIAKRVQEGTASSPQAAEYGRQARPLAELGWQFALRTGRT